MPITKVSTIEELKGIFIELLLNHTDKVTKVSNTSVLNGIAYGIAKIGQRTLKDIALIESHIFPDSAYGPYLDKVAENYGIAGRFQSTKSGTSIRIVGAVGTTYTTGTHTFTGNHGIIFELENNFTIPADGFGYARVRSQTFGSNTNVDPLTISKVSPIPTGHQYVINEFYATGGKDVESDEDFAKRIKDGPNILARGTIASIEQVFMLVNNDVFRVFYGGISQDGKVVLSIMTQSGVDLTTNQLDELLNKGNQFFNLSELRPIRTNFYGVSLQNIDWFPIDVSTRVELFGGFNQEDIRKEIQIKLNKYFDHRYFNKEKVEWDDLLQIVKSTTGVKYVLDNFFYPNSDFLIPRNKFARMRGFLLLNPDGTILSNSSNTLNPVFYPSKVDFAYQKTVYSTLI